MNEADVRIETAKDRGSVLETTEWDVNGRRFKRAWDFTPRKQRN